MVFKYFVVIVGGVDMWINQWSSHLLPNAGEYSAKNPRMWGNAHNGLSPHYWGEVVDHLHTPTDTSNFGGLFMDYPQDFHRMFGGIGEGSPERLISSTINRAFPQAIQTYPQITRRYGET